MIFARVSVMFFVGVRTNLQFAANASELPLQNALKCAGHHLTEMSAPDIISLA